MKSLKLALPLLIAAWANLEAAPIVGLFNSGVDNSGVVLTGGTGSPDPHWTVLGGGSALFAANQPGFYLPQTNARWINTSGTGIDAPSFTLLLQFDLTGFDFTTASISGRFAADNCAVIRLNGNDASSGGTVGPCGALTAFGQYTGFAFNSGFVSGMNTLAVEVTNELGTPGAALVEFLASDVQALSGGTGSEIPEPSTFLFAGTALALLAKLRRR